MSKISKNQRKSKELITKSSLDPRNWQCSSTSTYFKFWAETESEALDIARKELKSPKGTRASLNLKSLKWEYRE
jgi:hypothetical protein